MLYILGIMFVGILLCGVLYALLMVLGGVSIVLSAQSIGTMIFLQIQCLIFGVKENGIDLTKGVNIITIILSLVSLILLFIHPITQIICSATLAMFISTTIVYKNYEKMSSKTALIVVLGSLVVGIIVGIILVYNEKNIAGYNCMDMPILWNIASVIGGIYVVIVTDILFVVFKVANKTGTLKNIENIQKYKSIGFQGNILSLFVGVLVVFILIWEVPKFIEKYV